MQNLRIDVPQIFQTLRAGRKAVKKTAGWLFCLLHQRQHLQGCQQTIASPCQMCHQNMAGRFTTQIISVSTHLFQNIPVANIGAMQGQTRLAQAHFKTTIAHHRANHRITAQRAFLVQR